MSGSERYAYFNGTIVAESEVVVPFRDRSFKYGDGVFDTARTFRGRIFKLKEHVDRLYLSLKYTRIDPGLTSREMIELTEQVLEMNLPLLGEHDDYWVTQRISRGTDIPGGDVQQDVSPNVIIECTPLPIQARAHYYRDGMNVVFPSVRRASPDAMSPNVKTHNYLNMIMANLEVQSHSPGAWAILLDARGFLCEGLGSNLFLVRDGVLFTPKAEYVLEGISRQTILDLASELNLTIVEKDLTPYDAYRADEAFVTSTSFCLCPVATFDKIAVEDPAVPGPVTQKLTDAFSDLVDFDFVGQYLAHL